MERIAHVTHHFRKPITASTVMSAVDAAERNWKQAQKALSLHDLLPYQVDEIAILFRFESELEGFLREAKGMGIEHFNSVPHDDMVSKDGTHEFGVRFEFLRVVGATWRIEATCVLHGEAPIHQRHLDEYGAGACIHASFKCQDSDDYNRLMDSPDWGGSYPFVGEYSNDYGVFSYWSQAESGLYLKPRVNLRDSPVSA